MKSLSRQNKAELIATAAKFEVSAEGTNEEIRARIQEKIDGSTHDESNDNTPNRVVKRTNIRAKLKARAEKQQADIAARKAKAKKEGRNFGEAQ